MFACTALQEKNNLGSQKLESNSGVTAGFRTNCSSSPSQVNTTLHDREHLFSLKQNKSEDHCTAQSCRLEAFTQQNTASI